jgi:GTPase SAR1 family protein
MSATRSPAPPLLPGGEAVTRRVRIALIGPRGGGKTSLLASLLSAQYAPPKPTDGLACVSSHAQLNDALLRVEWLEVGGGLDAATRATVCQDAHGVLVVVDASLATPTWPLPALAAAALTDLVLSETSSSGIKHAAAERLRRLPIAVVVNKVDALAARVTTTASLETLCGAPGHPSVPAWLRVMQAALHEYREHAEACRSAHAREVAASAAAGRAAASKPLAERALGWLWSSLLGRAEARAAWRDATLSPAVAVSTRLALVPQLSLWQSWLVAAHDCLSCTCLTRACGRRRAAASSVEDGGAAAWERTDAAGFPLAGRPRVMVPGPPWHGGDWFAEDSGGEGAWRADSVVRDRRGGGGDPSGVRTPDAASPSQWPVAAPALIVTAAVSGNGWGGGGGSLLYRAMILSLRPTAGSAAVLRLNTPTPSTEFCYGRAPPTPAAFDPATTPPSHPSHPSCPPSATRHPTVHAGRGSTAPCHGVQSRHSIPPPPYPLPSPGVCADERVDATGGCVYPNVASNPAAGQLGRGSGWHQPASDGECGRRGLWRPLIHHARPQWRRAAHS